MRGRNLRAGTASEVVGGFQQQVVDAADVGVGEDKVFVGRQLDAPGQVGDVLAGHLAHNSRGRLENGLISGPFVSHVTLGSEERAGRDHRGNRRNAQRKLVALVEVVVLGDVGGTVVADAGIAVQEKLEVGIGQESILEVKIVGGNAHEVSRNPGPLDNIGAELIGIAAERGEIDVGGYGGIRIAEKDGTDGAIGAGLINNIQEVRIKGAAPQLLFDDRVIAIGDDVILGARRDCFVQRNGVNAIGIK